MLIVANPPKDPYKTGDALLYRDGEGGNGLNFGLVDVADGAVRYNVQVV